MISEHLLDIAMLVEIGLLVLAVCLFFAHGAWLFLHERRVRRLTESARGSLAHLATRGTVNVEEIEALRRIPSDVQVIALLEISRHLSGAAKERLSFVAGQVGVVDRARKLCESRRWSRRLRGARILSRLDVVDPLVQRLLSDSHPAVRAQAAEWAAAQPSVILISAMLKLLADPATQARFAVQNALLRMGGVVAGPLATFLERNSGRAAEAGLRVAESLAEPRFGAAALRLSRTSDVGVRIAAARLLGAVGEAEGAERLIELLEDDDPSDSDECTTGKRRHYWQVACATRRGESGARQVWRFDRSALPACCSFGARSRGTIRSPPTWRSRFSISHPRQHPYERSAASRD
jgi:HEAT repeat protein